jgi:hypothetical protein
MKYTRLATWIVLNSAILWLAWEAVGGNKGAGNLLVFIAWFFAVLTVTGAILIKEMKPKKTDFQRSVPSHVGALFEFFFTCFLAWHGWFFTAVAVILAWAAQESICRFMEENSKEAK